MGSRRGSEDLRLVTVGCPCHPKPSRARERVGRRTVRRDPPEALVERDTAKPR